MKSKSVPTKTKKRGMTRKTYEKFVNNAAFFGHSVITKYRKGLRSIRLGDIHLGEVTVRINHDQTQDQETREEDPA